VYASSGKLRGSGVPAREGHSLEKRIARDIRDNARKIPEGSVHHDSSRMIKGDPTRASSEWLRYPVRLWLFDGKEKREVQVSGRGKRTKKRTICEDEAFNATLSSGFLLPEEDPRDFIVDIGPILTMVGDAAYYAAALSKLMILLRERGRNGKTRAARTLLHGVQHERFNQYSSRDFDYN
ncbi:hypothetical protein ALC60_10728, partial [Trachymyrmex zeteki]